MSVAPTRDEKFARCGPAHRTLTVVRVRAANENAASLRSRPQTVSRLVIATLTQSYPRNDITTITY